MTVPVFLGTLHENSSVDQRCELGIAHQDTVDLTLGESLWLQGIKTLNTKMT